MLINNGDGTYTGGPLDVWGILHDVENGRFHPAFFREDPMPGPIESVEETKIVRLRSQMHHTKGSPTLEGAQALLDEMTKKILVRPGNIWRNEVYSWNGEPGITTLVPNWLNQEVHMPNPERR